MLFDSNAQPLMLGRVVVDGLGLTNVDIGPYSYHIFTSMGGLEKARKLTKQKIMIQVNLNKLTNFITVRAQVVVTHVMSYDVLVGGVLLYPLGVTIDFWEEILYYRLS
jgi:hypothetical protein